MLRTLPRLVVLMAVLLTSPASFAAEAEDGDLFTVKNIAVDVRARSASAAREQALNEGQVTALETMLKRLTLSRDWPRLPPAGPGLATSLVSSLEINDERISANRYQARLTLTFDPAGIRGLLRRAEIPFSEARYRPVLVLPIYAAGGLVSLWTDNPWRAAWDRAAAANGLIPYILPRETDAGDDLVSADTAMSLPDARLVQLRQRYGAANVIAVRADLVGQSGAAPQLAVRMQNYAKEGAVDFEVTLRGNGGNISDLAQEAAEAVRTRIEDDWKQQTLARFDERNRLTVRVPVDSLAEWHSVATRLEDNLLVDEVDILTLTSEYAELRLHYLGDVARLRTSLAQTNLTLEPTSKAEESEAPPPEDPAWQLHATSNAAP